MVRLAGFEPATCCSGGNRSIHLSYRRPLRRSVARGVGAVKWTYSRPYGGRPFGGQRGQASSRKVNVPKRLFGVLPDLRFV